MTVDRYITSYFMAFFSLGLLKCNDLKNNVDSLLSVASGKIEDREG